MESATINPLLLQTLEKYLHGAMTALQGRSDIPAVVRKAVHTALIYLGDRHATPRGSNNLWIQQSIMLSGGVFTPDTLPSISSSATKKSVTSCNSMASLSAASRSSPPAASSDEAYLPPHKWWQKATSTSTQNISQQPPRTRHRYIDPPLSFKATAPEEESVTLSASLAGAEAEVKQARISDTPVSAASLAGSAEFPTVPPLESTHQAPAFGPATQSTPESPDTPACGSPPVKGTSEYTPPHLRPGFKAKLAPNPSTDLNSRKAKIVVKLPPQTYSKALSGPRDVSQVTDDAGKPIAPHLRPCFTAAIKATSAYPTPSKATTAGSGSSKILNRVKSKNMPPPPSTVSPRLRPSQEQLEQGKSHQSKPQQRRNSTLAHSQTKTSQSQKSQKVSNVQGASSNRAFGPSASRANSRKPCTLSKRPPVKVHPIWAKFLEENPKKEEEEKKAAKLAREARGDAVFEPAPYQLNTTYKKRKATKT